VEEATKDQGNGLSDTNTNRREARASKYDYRLEK